MSDTENRFSIETVSLTAGYGKKEVIRELSFGVSPGEIITLIGPNGSGKSTILKSIASQLKHLSGKVFICGKDETRMNEKEISKKLSVLLTKKADPEMITCGEVVESGRYPYTGILGFLNEDDRKAAENAMELTGITYLKNQDYGCISDGQRQLVMLARAICQETDIMILDEPTSFLDVSHKLELLSILERLVREKKTAVIMSLHEIELAQKISDRIICIKNGRADRTGTPDEIFSGNYINGLYDIKNSRYNEYYCSAELPAPSGEPEVFVIGGGGNGVNVYRKLQKLNIPFAAGIIHENDIEYPAAISLAAEVISEKAFEPVSESTLKNALDIMEKCSKVICCVSEFGKMNSLCRELLESGEKSGKITDIDKLL